MTVYVREPPLQKATTVSTTRPFLDHWLNIDPERMARYEVVYQWTSAADAYYASAEIGLGQVVANFGCGPGHAASEFARGATG